MDVYGYKILHAMGSRYEVLTTKYPLVSPPYSARTTFLTHYFILILYIFITIDNNLGYLFYFITLYCLNKYTIKFVRNRNCMECIWRKHGVSVRWMLWVLGRWWVNDNENVRWVWLWGSAYCTRLSIFHPYS